MRWWFKRESDETKATQEKLEEVKRDDYKVDELARRAKRIIKENNLAPDIMKALGMRR